nr:CP19k-like protein 4 isoform 2 [Chthamalus malayensis]
MRFFLILLCVAVALAVPTGNRRRPRPKPICNPSTLSKLGQKGHTSGGGAVSASTSTQGSGSINCVFKGPNLKVDTGAAANSGVAGTGVSAGEGAFGQNVRAGSGVKSVPGITKVTTGTAAGGATGGGAAVTNKAGANAGAKTSVEFGRRLKKIKILEKQERSGTSSSGHEASSTGDGTFSVDQKGKTVIKLKGPLVGVISPLDN